MKERIFYKYRKINNYTYDLLSKNEFYYSYPHELNDPFDCYIYSDYHGNEEEWKNKLEEITFLDKGKKDKIFQFVKSLNFDKEEIKKHSPSIIRDNFSKLEILTCFTEKNDSIIMWSHYADEHKGICLGFKSIHSHDSTCLDMAEVITDLPHPLNQYAPLFKVGYSYNLPEPYNGIIEKPENITRFMKTKYKEWEYEKEYRSILLFEDLKKKNIKFKKNILAEVIWGMKINDSDKNSIKTLIEELYIKSGVNVKFKKTIQVQDDYRIEIIDD